MHVEVRRDGDLAGRSEQLVVPFRRYLFSVGLDFSTQTDTNGSLVHKATASSTRSMWGTPYRLKLKDADGTELCSTASDAQCGPTTVNVGDTYRAVVEDSDGRNFGDSGAWTLTPDGARSEFVDGVDLALLGDLVTRDEICETALVSGGPSSDGNSVPDVYEACEASVGRGATVLQVLRDVLAVGGGLTVIHLLDGDQMAPRFDPGADPEDWETMVAPPLPGPQRFREDKLADSLQVRNAGLSAAEANAVARQCLYLVATRGLNGDAECQSYPIFASGSDVAEATKHDLEALKSWRPWMLLNYDERGRAKPGYGTWYRTVSPCIPGTYDGGTLNCDEFPFISTLQGGPEPLGGRQPHLKVINALDNQLQGSLLYSRFYSACGFTARVDHPSFLNVPLPPTGAIPTLGLCNSPG